VLSPQRLLPSRALASGLALLGLPLCGGGGLLQLPPLALYAAWLGFTQRKHFGVCGGIAGGDGCVVRLPDDHVVEDNDRADRYLARREAGARFGERRPHEYFGVQCLAS
jgi:hypothetical protein